MIGSANDVAITSVYTHETHPGQGDEAQYEATRVKDMRTLT